MDKTKKKSIIIDLNETPPTKAKSYKGLLTSIIIFALITAAGSAIYLASSNEQKTNEDTTEQTIQNDTSLPTTPAITTTAVAIAQPLTLKTTQEETAIEVEQPPQSIPIHFDSIQQQLNQLLARIPDTTKPIAIESLEIQLQQALDNSAHTEEITILQNALATQSLNFCITQIDTVNLETINTIQNLKLTSHAPIKWNEYTQLHKIAQPIDDYSTLEHKLAEQEQLKQVITIASQSLQALAKKQSDQENHTEANPIYQTLLAIDPNNTEASQHLHRHIHNAGHLNSGRYNMLFAFIPAGNYRRGTPETEFRRDADETLQEVTLTQSIWIATTEVTQAQWMSVMGRLPRNFDKNSHTTGDNFPIHSLTWSEATDFCRKLSDIDTANTYRLPTEAEWEIACRAGSNSAYSNSGDSLRITEANVFDANSDQTLDAATTVASYTPNAWGLYDMHGNLWEWTSDWSGDYSETQTVNPTGPDKDSETDINLRTRILRGGSYYDEVASARSGNRWEYAPSIATDYIGFRIVKENTL